MAILFLLLSTIIWRVRSAHQSYTIEEYQALTNRLLANYSSKIRPIRNQGQTLPMKVSLWISSINDVNDVAQKMVTSAYLAVRWTDAMLIWNSTETRIDWMQFNQKDLWIPDLVLSNGFTAFKPLGGDFYFLNVNSNGKVSWYPFMVFETKCKINVSFYPFDSQTCKIEFKTWSYNRYEVNLTVSKDKIGFYDFVENSVWEVTSTDAVNDFTSSEPTVSFIIHLQRKSLYYIMNVFLPIIFLGILSPVVFIIPADAGEKMGYAVTIFLTFVVFLTIVSSNLPVNSDSVSYMEVYLVIKLLFGAMIIVITSIQLRINHRKPEREIGKELRAIVRLKDRLRCIHKRSDSDLPVMVDKGKAKEANEEDISWNDVSSAIDFYSFWFLVLADIAVTSSIFAYTSLN
ncbi:neuronal acetylcholine receptor subunit alpha-6-like [Saccostrea echinata]|uniref:neuronal acetylcholine receptor subunit alpha-6-like n=1 Tax=Saccostrea echinata TaxID=191078 RepID=UPI002A808A90|nr:neuronal acetylcholine receptor subunit alpha-6-like [Saccostrea echinata]